MSRNSRRAALVTFADIGSPERMRKAESFDSRPPIENLEEPETQVDNEGLRKARLELLAAVLWAKLGDPSASVSETNPNELTIELGDLSWVITVSDEGKISVSGFDSGVEQYIGKMPDVNTEISLIKIADNAMELINEDIEENGKPPAEPIHFGPEAENFNEMDDPSLEMESVPSPETAMGDEMDPSMGGEMPMDPSMGMDPSMMDPSMGMGSQGMPPQAPPMGMPPQAPPMGMPPQAPPMGMPPQAPPPAMPGQPPAQPMPQGFPQASRRSLNREQINRGIRTASKRLAIHQLDEAASELEAMSQAVGEKENGTLRALATRIDRITNTLEQ